MPKVPNSPYWIKRAEQALIANEKTAKQQEQLLEMAYKRTLAQIKKEVEAFYGKYAKDNKISLAEARKRLNPKELSDFKTQADIYLKEVEKHKDSPNLKAYATQLKQLSAKAYITKMDEITTNVNHQLETLSIGQFEGMKTILGEAYQGSFYKTMFDIQKQAGFGVSFTQPGGKQLHAAINERWLGKNYSDRIWANKNSLVLQLERILSQEFVLGKGPNEVAKTFAQKLNTSYNNAKRLIRTEMNYISNKGTMKAYKESGVLDGYQYVSTLDSRTSDICIALDNKVFKLAEAKTGINYPPMHPNCRSTTIPYFPDDEISPLIEDRVAKDANGKTYKVGNDVSYVEWVKSYADSTYANKVLQNAAAFAFMDKTPEQIDTAGRYTKEELLDYEFTFEIAGQTTTNNMNDYLEYNMTYESFMQDLGLLKKYNLSALDIDSKDPKWEELFLKYAAAVKDKKLGEFEAEVEKLVPKKEIKIDTKVKLKLPNPYSDNETEYDLAELKSMSTLAKITVLKKSGMPIEELIELMADDDKATEAITKFYNKNWLEKYPKGKAEPTKEIDPLKPEPEPNISVNKTFKAKGSSFEKFYNAFEEMTGEESNIQIEVAEKWFKTTKKGQEVMDAFHEYTGNAYHWMNRWYRNDKNNSLVSWEKELIMQIEDGFKKAPKAYKKDTRIYRATGYSYFRNAGMPELGDEVNTFSQNANRYKVDETFEDKKKKLEDKLKNSLIGVEVTEKSFTSTSYEKGAFGRSKPVQLTIDAPAKISRAIQLGGISEFGKLEAEILHAPGMVNKIKNVYLEEDRHGDIKVRFEVDLVGYDDK